MGVVVAVSRPSLCSWESRGAEQMGHRALVHVTWLGIQVFRAGQSKQTHCTSSQTFLTSRRHSNRGQSQILLALSRQSLSTMNMHCSSRLPSITS
jgi:hypothetical protein